MSNAGPSKRSPLCGGCACGAQRYAVTASPLIVHACHCRDCQRITGSAFVINLWIESEHVTLTQGGLLSARLSAGSGKAHEVFFCPGCGTYLWSRYQRVPADCLFVRAGTLDRPDAVTPDVHIFTRSKLPWVELPAGARAFTTGYRIDAVWPAASRERLRRSRAARGSAAPAAPAAGR
ncbi:MAG: GFA family protein [Thermodesulfobacteriota bacterium]